jgi:hypothetical protein
MGGHDPGNVHLCAKLRIEYRNLAAYVQVCAGLRDKHAGNDKPERAAV